LGTAIRAVLSFILAFFGAFFGWGIAQNTREFYRILSPPLQTLNTLAFVCLGILLGVAIAPIVTRTLMALIAAVAAKLETLTLQEILLGAVGLIFGLIIAFFTSLLMSNLPIDKIPVIGEYLAPLVIVLITIFWAVLGAFFGTRMAVVHTLSNVFTNPASLVNISSPGVTKLLDTSVVIDGRVGDILKAGFLEGAIVIPRFVLEELQLVADSADPLKRVRGRRGLNMLETLQKDHGIQILDKDLPEIHGVDSKLVRLAQEAGAVLVTTDYNLNRVATLQGVKVLNINELANAVKAVVLPGEEMAVQIMKEGKEHGQGVGYLEDGTMIVVEDGRRSIGATVIVEVTRVLQTHAGKMIFGRVRQQAERKSS
jgi:uncharacterized protein YacL